MRRLSTIPIFMILLLASPAFAGEAITYNYDANGRLTKTDRAGTVNNGTNVEYVYDPADNRIKYKITGTRSKVIVVPLNGLTVIPIPEQ